MTEIMKGIINVATKNGYKVLKQKRNDDWVYLITPSNNVLMVTNEYFGGYNLVFKYKPNKECGTGCCAFNSYDAPIMEWLTKPLQILKEQEPILEKWAKRMKAPFYSSPDEWRKEQEEKWHIELEEVV